MVLTLTLQSAWATDQHCWAFWGKMLSRDALEQEIPRKLKGVDFFVCSCPCLCPPPTVGESTSAGKVVHAASPSLLDNPLSGNWHCLRRANLPIIMPPRAVHIQSRVDSSISDPGSSPQFRKTRQDHLNSELHWGWLRLLWQLYQSLTSPSAPAFPFPPHSFA